MSAEDQEWWDERVPVLLNTPAAVRFVSAEPLLGPIKISGVCSCGTNYQTGPLIHGDRHHHELHWLIIGGESGPGARPMDLAWARSVVRQCQAAGVAVFVKQLGAKPREHFRDLSEWPVDLKWCVGSDVPPVSSADREDDWWAPSLRDRKGGDMSEWPEDLKVREFPWVGR